MEWLVYVVIFWSIPFAFMTRWLAGLKGYAEPSWAIVGLFFGPFAVLTIGLAPRGYGPPFMACVECSEAIHSDATRCPFCQTDLIAEHAAEDELDPDEPEAR